LDDDSVGETTDNDFDPEVEIDDVKEHRDLQISP
jgi:hypothetical protein